MGYSTWGYALVMINTYDYKLARALTRYIPG